MKFLMVVATLIASSLVHAQVDYKVLASCETIPGHGYPARSYLTKQSTDSGPLYKFIYFNHGDPRSPAPEFGVEVQPYSTNIRNGQYNIAFETEGRFCRLFLSGKGTQGDIYRQGCVSAVNSVSRCDVDASAF